MGTAIRTLAAAMVGCLAGAACGQAPANDTFANAQVITGVSGTTAGTNVNATLAMGEPTTTAGRSGGRSVWFNWTAPASGSFTFSLTAGFDSQLAVYTGTGVGSLTVIAESDLPESGGDSLTFSATQGTNYRIRVTGYLSQAGVFTSHWSVNPVYETVFSFTEAAATNGSNKGTYPYAGLVQGSDGNFYGTTTIGGLSEKGTVFKMTPAGVLTTLVEFTGNGTSNKGRRPQTCLVQSGDGNFYGTTLGGGANGYGTVFKMTPAGVLTTLVEFTDNGISNKGMSPAGLVQGSDGNFYGTTNSGGASGEGTVFKMTPAGVLTTLVEFTGNGTSNKGSDPNAALVQGSDGNFYGTTTYGGASNNGTVFKMTPAGVLTTLVEFTDNGTSNKGRRPYSSLVRGGDGNFYGTTEYGGASDDGTVFKMTPVGVLTTLVEFTRNGTSNKGSEPGAGLVQGIDGNFYGTTGYGGASDHGTVFKMTPAGELTTLVEFTGNGTTNKGRNPYADLVQGGDGNICGTTARGGASDYGTVFMMTSAGELTTLVEFTGNGTNNKGRNPYAGLVQDSDGNFYGTTAGDDASDLGTVFKMTPAGELTTVVEFTGNGTSNKGSTPFDVLVQGSDGNFYGTTAGGGASGRGTVFKMTPAGELTTLVEFTGNGTTNKGGWPEAGLVQGGDGNFYGTTDSGGTSNYGTVFKMTPAGELTTLVEFTGNGTTNKGSFPHACLVRGVDGNFYGTTTKGGASNNGTVFKMTPAGVLTTLVEFTHNGTSNKGSDPEGSLVQGIDGNFYGTTLQGGANYNGTVFKMTPAGVLTTLVDFTDNGTTNKGRLPHAGLVQGSDGNFYGTTLGGGASDVGTVFKMTSVGVLTTLYDFREDTAGSAPLAAFVAGSDGNLYGTTTYGIFGGIYRMVFPGAPNVFPLSPEGLSSTGAILQCEVNPRGAATLASLEFGSDGVVFPNPVAIPLRMSGYQSILVGRTLNNLTPGTTYYYRFRATSSAGETVSPVRSFSTLAEPAVASAPASDILPTSARFNGTVNARNFAATVVFEWGADGNSFPNTVAATPGVVTGNTPVPVSADVAGLVKGTTYYYRVVATNVAGTGVSGTQGFTTLTEPVAVLGGASALSTTRARVEGTVNAMGSTAAVAFEWGIDGINFPSSVAASPATVGGGGPVAVSAVLTGLTQGTTYHYRIRATGPGGTGYSGSGTFSLSILSGLVQVFPDPPPPGAGTVTVAFDPPSRGAWRFAGEQAWRSSGVAAGQLASGPRLIEFLPVPGYIGPPQETLDVTYGVNLTLDRVYFSTLVAGSGSLTVRLKPDEPGAQWRFVGETVWRDSGGDPLGGLVAGSYLIECKPVAGRVTPPVASVAIADGDSRELTLTYFTSNNPVGAAPLPLDFGSVATDEDKPFAYVGQIRSEVGSSTGFVVKRRVVATAGHVVFDDGTLSYLTGLQWLFQRHSGEHEPYPQVPRGYYLAAGYAEQRIADASPGEGSAQSQDLDYAALYFLEEAGRGGYGGFLATDAGDDNEFLGSMAEKILAGYATDGIPAADQGRLHATAAFTAALTPTYGETWTSTAARGLGGCSGGPLFVRSSNGSYFPAAIYLGGSGQTVVRAINSEVVELFNRAEVSGNGGDNNTGGGITHTSVTAIGSTTQPGSLKVFIEPEAARTAGAGWRLKPEAIYRLSGTQKGSLSPGTYVLEFTAVSGFPAPPQQAVAVTGGQLTTLTFTYGQTFTALEAWRLTHFGTTTNTGSAADSADPDHDGQPNLAEYTAGTHPNNAADVFKVLTAQKTGASFTITASGKAGRTYVLERNTNLAAVPWTPLGSAGPLAADGPVVLSDSAPPANTGFYRLRVSAP